LITDTYIFYIFYGFDFIFIFKLNKKWIWTFIFETYKKNLHGRLNSRFNLPLLEIWDLMKFEFFEKNRHMQWLSLHHCTGLLEPPFLARYWSRWTSSNCAYSVRLKYKMFILSHGSRGWFLYGLKQDINHLSYNLIFSFR